MKDPGDGKRNLGRKKDMYKGPEAVQRCNSEINENISMDGLVHK